MNRECIVSVGIGSWHPVGVLRLEDNLRALGWQGGVLTWKDQYPEGSPSHEQVSHGFKPWAMRAAQLQGKERVLWLDASVTLKRLPAALFERMAQVGYLFVATHNTVGNFSSDHCLSAFGVSREQARSIPEIATGFIGLDLRFPEMRAFLDEWCAWTERGGGSAFNGSKRNDRFQVSADPQVEGHRQDQTVASLIAHRMGLRSILDGHNWQSVIDCICVNPHPVTHS